MTEVNEAPEGASSGGDGAEPLLKLRGIDKHFGPVQALYGVKLDLVAGWVTGPWGGHRGGEGGAPRQDRRRAPAGPWPDLLRGAAGPHSQRPGRLRAGDRDRLP